jgi:hypothetical protein
VVATDTPPSGRESIGYSDVDTTAWVVLSYLLTLLLKEVNPMTDPLDNDDLDFSDHEIEEAAQAYRDEIKIREQLKLNSRLIKKKSNDVLKKVKELEALVEEVRPLIEQLEAMKRVQ